MADPIDHDDTWYARTAAEREAEKNRVRNLHMEIAVLDSRIASCQCPDASCALLALRRHKFNELRAALR